MKNARKSKELCDKLIEIMASQETPIRTVFFAILVCKHALLTDAGFWEPARNYVLNTLVFNT